MSPRQGREIIVRPRVIWAGVAAALLGMVGTGLALSSPVHAWTLLGAAVIAAGFAISWSGGILGDVRTAFEGRREMRELMASDVHRDASPHDRHATLAAGHDAVATNRRTREVLWRARHVQVRRDPPVLITAWALIALAVWLMLSPWAFGFNREAGAQGVIVRLSIEAVLIIVCGTWLHQVGRNRVVSGVAFVVSLAVVASGLFQHPLSAVYDVNQVVVGVLMAVMAVASLFRAPPLPANATNGPP